jgi:hypothetical protein
MPSAEIPDPEYDSGDRMLMLLVESSDAIVGDIARSVLEALGFRVEVAADDRPATLVFDYAHARFSVIALVGVAPIGLKVPEVDGLLHRTAGGHLFAVIMQGVDMRAWLADSVQIELDAGGRWADWLADDLRRQGWLD